MGPPFSFLSNLVFDLCSSLNKDIPFQHAQKSRENGADKKMNGYKSNRLIIFNKKYIIYLPNGQWTKGAICGCALSWILDI